MSCGVSFPLVMKNTSPPVSEASRSADSSPDSPEEINPTQPAPSSPLTPSVSYSWAGLKTRDRLETAGAQSADPFRLVLVDVPGAVDVPRHERVVGVEEQPAFV